MDKKQKTIKEYMAIIEEQQTTIDGMLDAAAQETKTSKTPCKGGDGGRSEAEFKSTQKSLEAAQADANRLKREIQDEKTESKE